MCRLFYVGLTTRTVTTQHFYINRFEKSCVIYPPGYGIICYGFYIFGLISSLYDGLCYL